MSRTAMFAFAIALVAAFTTAGCDDSSGASSSGDQRWSEADGFNPEEEDYSNEGSDIDCSEVDGPVEIDPDEDHNNLDRDGDGLACEWG